MNGDKNDKKRDNLWLKNWYRGIVEIQRHKRRPNEKEENEINTHGDIFGYRDGWK